MLYVPLFEDRLLTKNDLEGDQDRHGLELLTLPTLVCTVHTAWRRAQDRADWRMFVTTATLHYSLGACIVVKSR